MKNILAATNFSQTGNNAVMAAIAICRQHVAEMIDINTKAPYSKLNAVYTAPDLTRPGY